MARYIVSRTGYEISEEALKEIFDMHHIFSETEYENWIDEKIKSGVIRILPEKKGN